MAGGSVEQVDVRRPVLIPGQVVGRPGPHSDDLAVARQARRLDRAVAVDDRGLRHAIAERVERKAGTAGPDRQASTVAAVMLAAGTRVHHAHGLARQAAVAGATRRAAVPAPVVEEAGAARGCRHAIPCAPVPKPLRAGPFGHAATLAVVVMTGAATRVDTGPTAVEVVAGRALSVGDADAGAVVMVPDGAGPCAGTPVFGGTVTLNSFYSGYTISNLAVRIEQMSPVAMTENNSDGPQAGLADEMYGIWTYAGGAGSSQTWCFAVTAQQPLWFYANVYGDLTPSCRRLGRLAQPFSYAFRSAGCALLALSSRSVSSRPTNTTTSSRPEADSPRITYRSSSSECSGSEIVSESGSAGPPTSRRASSR